MCVYIVLNTLTLNVETTWKFDLGLICSKSLMEVVEDPTPESVFPQWSMLLEDRRAGGRCLGHS